VAASAFVLEWPERDVVFEKAEKLATRQSADCQDPAVSTDKKKCIERLEMKGDSTGNAMK
jgi:hypothetical protein